MFRKLKRYWRDPYHEIGYDMLWRHPNWMSDRWYLKTLWKRTYGYELDLKHPRTFSEKLQWLKLYDRKPIYHQMVDKVKAKSFIDDVIGNGYTIPTIGVFESFEEIDWEVLPDRFILKATHDSGSYFIVTNKNEQKNECKKHLYIHWDKDYYLKYREWQYKGLEHRIIAEPLIASPKDLKEYKFFCFDGEPRVFQTCYDRDNSRGGAELNFFDLDGNKLDIRDVGHSRETTYRFGLSPNLKKMVMFCRKLAADTFFLRVDFYETPDNKMFCGELTFHENAGFCSFKPDCWNYTLGDWIKLPTDSN